jgi:hypothetical protein
MLSYVPHKALVAPINPEGLLGSGCQGRSRYQDGALEFCHTGSFSLLKELNESQWPARITAFVSVVALVATIYFQYSTAKHQIDHEILEHRQGALFEALRVIDNVYSNEPLENGKAPNPHNWDIQLARDADNQMRIYCKYPETRLMFMSALGLYNPQNGKPPGINLKALDKFRRQVAKELDLPEPVGSDDNLIWIAGLAGATTPTEAAHAPLKNAQVPH